MPDEPLGRWLPGLVERGTVDLAARMLRLPLDRDAMADLGVRRADVMAGGAGRRPRT